VSKQISKKSNILFLLSILILDLLGAGLAECRRWFRVWVLGFWVNLKPKLLFNRGGAGGVSALAAGNSSWLEKIQTAAAGAAHVTTDTAVRAKDDVAAAGVTLCHSVPQRPQTGHGVL
jgi:hypothetical protein